MMQRFITIFIAVELEHREIHDPEKVPLVVLTVGFDHAQFPGQVLTHPVEGFVHRCGVAGTEQQQRARLGSGAAQQLLLLLIAEVVLDCTDGVDLSTVANADEGQSTGPGGLGFAEHIATGLDAHIGEGIVAAGHGDHLHRTTGFDGAAEHLETHVLDDVRHGHKLHAVTGVGSIGAIALHGVMPGHAREGAGQLNAFHLLPDGADQ